jgi:hypothetical protein
MLYKVKTANRLMTHKEALSFLWYCHGINARNAADHMIAVHTS